MGAKRNIIWNKGKGNFIESGNSLEDKCCEVGLCIERQILK